MANPKFPYKPLIRALDVKAGTHYRPFGRTKLDYSVQDDYSPARRDIRQDGDTTVTTVTGQGRPTVETFTPETKLDLTSGFILSGLAAPTLTFSGTWAMNPAQLESVVERSSKEPSGYTGLIPEPKMKDQYHSSRSSYAMDNDIAETFLLNYDSALNNAPLIKTPGKYTGEMRKVVQCMHGMGMLVPFEYQWERCHGVFTGSDGKKWVIEISDRGIHAARLKTLQSPATLKYYSTLNTTFDLSYLPDTNDKTIPYDNTELNARVASGKVLQLASAAEVATFYGLTPFFEDCGWAFSYSGGEAQNTAYDFEPVSARWIISHRYKVVFDEQFIDGRLAPAVASFAEIESGPIHGDRISHFKVPASRSGGVVSFDIFRGEFSGPGLHDSPFYVFYSGETEQVCRYKAGETITTVTYSDSVSGNSVLNSSNMEEYPFTQVIHRNGTETTSRPDEMYVNTAEAPTRSMFNGTIKRFYCVYTGVPGGNNIHTSGTSFYSLSPDSGYTYCHKVSGSALGTSVTFSATIPYGDRESIYIYRKEHTRYESASETLTYRPIAAGEARQRLLDGDFDVYSTLYADNDPYPVMIPGAHNEWDGERVLQWTQYLCPPIDVPHTPGTQFTPNISVAGELGTSNPNPDDTYTAVDAYGNLAHTDTLTLHASLTAPITLFEGRDVLAIDPVYGYTEWMAYVSDPELPAGNTDNYQFYHVVPDAFTGNRFISDTDGGMSEASYFISGVNAGYQPAYSANNRDRYFFGAP